MAAEEAVVAFLEDSGTITVHKLSFLSANKKDHLILKTKMLLSLHIQKSSLQAVRASCNSHVLQFGRTELFEL